MANVNDVYQIRFVSFLLSQLGVITPKYVVVTKSGTGATDSQIASALNTNVAASFKAMLNASVTFRGTGAKKIFPSPPGVEASDVSSAGAGTGGTLPLPLQCSGLISWVTAVGSRKGRGRTYPPFPGQSDIDATSTFIASYQTRLTALAAAMRVTMTAGVSPNQNNLQLCLFNVPTSVFTLVTGSITHTQVATQRRRGFFGRQNTVPF